MQIVFTPAATGPITATLAISSSTPGVAAVEVPLNGASQPGSGFAVSPMQVVFANPVGVGQASAAQTVTIEPPHFGRKHRLYLSFGSRSMAGLWNGAGRGRKRG